MTARAGRNSLRHGVTIFFMLRNPKIAPKALFPFCRSMGRMLEAGVEVRKALRTSSAHSSDSRLTESAGEVLTSVKKGDDLTASFVQQAYRFPRLLLDLVKVGEQTGSMPEVMFSLADYYEAGVNRMREFRSQIAWPLIQLFAAILIIGFLIYLLGVINPSSGPDQMDILGLGLQGTRGAAIWFGSTLGFLFFTWLGVVILNRSAAGQLALHPFLMMIPAVGKCMRSFAIARFSWCFALTQKAGMPIRPSLESSINATGNGAFIVALPEMWRMVKEGETLTDALAATNLFPKEFLHIVDTAEQTGTVPEALDRMSKTFDEDAHRAMTRMTNIMAAVIWGIVACFIAFIVISFFMNYVAQINELSKGI